MSDWFYFFSSLMILGFCHAFDRFSRIKDFPENSDDVSSMTSRHLPQNDVHRRVGKSLENSWSADNPTSVDNHRGRRMLEHFEGSNTVDRDLRSSANWDRDNSSVGKRNNKNSTNSVDGSSGRRHFWEPIFDGKVIGSIGELFSDNIKKEADSERSERENIRRENLLNKYMTMLNDPKQLADLKRESDNSPKEINQTIAER